MPGDQMAVPISYTDRLHKKLSDPERLNAVYGSAFMSRANDVKLNGVCASVGKLLRGRGSDLMLLTGEEQKLIATWRDGDFFPVPPSAPVEETICQHNLMAMEIGHVAFDDMTLDQRVCDLSFVVDKTVRSYLGVPIVVNGHVVGSLCVLDDKVREWTQVDVMLLSGFAEEAMALASNG